MARSSKPLIQSRFRVHGHESLELQFRLTHRLALRHFLPDDEPWALPIEWAKRRGYEQIVELLR